MGILNMHYIGLASGYSEYPKAVNYLTFDGRFLIGANGLFIDTLLHQFNDIVVPIGLPLLNLVPTQRPPIFVNLLRQEVLCFIESQSASNIFLALYDFKGHLKTVVDFPSNNTSFIEMYDAIGYWDNRYWISARAISNSAVQIFSYVPFGWFTLETTQLWEDEFQNVIILPYQGFLYVRSDWVSATDLPWYTYQFGSVPPYTPIPGTYSLPGVTFRPGQDLACVYKQKLAVCLLGSQPTVNAENLIVFDLAGDTYLTYGGELFNMRFPKIANGVPTSGLVTRAFLFYAGLPYVVLDGGLLFSAVFYENLSSHFSDNFARGVPIAGFHA